MDFRSITSMVRKLALCAAAIALAPSTTSAQQKAVRGAEDPSNPCGVIYGEHYGPYDYRWDRHKLKIVEDFHFTPQVEALRAGQSGYIGGDLNYTLTSFPNHHRALIAMVKHTERQKTSKANGMKYPLECYFDRALRYAPDDTKVRSIYAQYLSKSGRKNEALLQLDTAVEYARDSGAAHYNIGVVYYQMKQYEKARQQALKARELGVGDRQLEELLKRSGNWAEPR